MRPTNMTPARWSTCSLVTSKLSPEGHAVPQPVAGRGRGARDRIAFRIDVGRDTAGFARSKGFVTYRGTLQDCRFPSAHFDAVFVWNCFEQIDEPHLILTEIKRVLKPGGLLLLRTPNALFYRVCQRFLAASPAVDVATWVRRALGYNNLLAFPYLYGYQSQTLL
jgi:ubiquinone/menaquinone biosynthesis C-methylase UbiE